MSAANMTWNKSVEQCQFANWYPLLKEFVLPTSILVAPDEFREYLLADGITLNGDENESSSEWETDVPKEEEINGLKDNDSDDSENTRCWPPTGFHREIEEAICQLGGKVAPKLNWSAPQDAVWVLPDSTMCCKNANDIYMLLKSSDYINHDLQLNPPKLTLVLREWFDIHPSHEFRCFIRDKKLVGVSQRDMNYYEFLSSSKSLIENLCLDTISRIARVFPLNSFVADIYISKSFKKAWIIDINPWMVKTDSMLFTWDELPQINDVEVRLIDKKDRTRTFSSKPHSTSQVPYELVDMPRATIREMLEQMKLQRKREATEI